MSSPPRGWDLPTRVFHWTLATLVTFSFVTGKLGESWLEWHFRSGYAILALLGFRIAWGFIGSHEARFAAFVRGPRAALEYARSIASGKRAVMPGHNPLGGWMVVLMIALLVAQATTGLFSNDESFNEGPLASKVSKAIVDRMSSFHSWNEWAIVGAVALHVTAVLTYQLYLRMNIVGPMVLGESRAKENARALVVICIAAAAVYWLVTVYPK
ncbi:MAG TPA: cytochrome b/b6 domain-containing protein [Usitatibacter sp.]|nr:cytochrome b/b6 domain-containing protein [Usitatibacter sp.]